MAKKQDKTDEQILKEIIDRIGKRVTSIESELQQFIELKAWEVRRLESAIIKLANGMDAVYGHNEAARAAVAQHYGTCHPPIVAALLKRVKEAKSANS